MIFVIKHWFNNTHFVSNITKFIFMWIQQTICVRYFTAYHLESFFSLPVVESVTMCYLFYWACIYQTCQPSCQYLCYTYLFLISCIIKNLSSIISHYGGVVLSYCSMSGPERYFHISRFFFKLNLSKKTYVFIYW